MKTKLVLTEDEVKELEAQQKPSNSAPPVEMTLGMSNAPPATHTNLGTSDEG